MQALLFLCADMLTNKVFVAETESYNMKLYVEINLEDALKILGNKHIDAIIVTLPLPTLNCPKKLIQSIQDLHPYLPIFIMMDQLEVTLAIELTKMGAEYCFSRPYAPDQIINKVQSICQTLNRNNTPAPKPILNPIGAKDTNYLEAKSRQAQLLYQQIDLVANTNFTVIIYGETGTGKESVARRLCRGMYRDKPFVAVDCGCLSIELAASELFGHQKGSFSGATEDKIGAFEAASGGTIFLDEIGNLSYEVQMLLLRAIEEKKIKRVGSNKEIPINTRIITASNEKLYYAVEAGNFREDLFYRLNEFEINIPPLRERVEDIAIFIDFFIQQVNFDLGKKISGVQPAVLSKLQHYQWPGNIRELKNVIRRACLLAKDIIDPACFSHDFWHKIATKPISEDSSANVYTSTYNLSALKIKGLLAEYEQIIQILKEENFNKTKAAQRLNINRKTLYNKMKSMERLR